MNPRRATIDIGSNTVLLLLAEVSPYRELAKLSEVTGLGKGLDKTGEFARASMDDSYAALARYAQVCADAGVPAREIIATATEASRVARNAPAFYEKVRRELGIDVRIITGQAEAELTTKGVLFNTTFTAPEVVIMDIGGASTEFIRVSTADKKILSSVSLKCGSVRASDWLRDGVFEERLTTALAALGGDGARYQSSVLHCVAGTLTSLGNMHLGNKTFVEDEVHGLTITRADIEALAAKTQGWGAARFLSEFPFLGKRSEAMRGGIELTLRLLGHFRVEKCVISTYGLRYGTFLEGGIADGYLAK